MGDGGVNSKGAVGPPSNVLAAKVWYFGVWSKWGDYDTRGNIACDSRTSGVGYLIQIQRY